MKRQPNVLRSKLLAMTVASVLALPALELENVGKTLLAINQRASGGGVQHRRQAEPAQDRVGDAGAARAFRSEVPLFLNDNHNPVT